MRRYSETEIVRSVEGLTITRLRAFIAADCVAPDEHDGRLEFGEADVARLQLLTEISNDFNLDEDAAALVISLVDQIYGLRRQMRALAAALSSEPEEVRARVRLRLAPRDGS